MERRAGTLYEIQGDRARVRWLDGQLGALPLAPFRTLSIAPGDPFVLVTVYRGSQVASVRIERSGTRPAVIDRPLPKVVMRDGIKLTTRR
jgi:hypothetical protein